nr:SIR2 family protein [Roseomonas acroporae]
MLIPYLGPGVTALGAPAIPVSDAELATFLGDRVALPRRARGNLWAAAQFIESRRHRKALVSLMSEAYALPAPPVPMQHWLAGLRPSMIVDTWYDGAMRAALAGTGQDWGEIQGITRAGIGEARWYRAYDHAGAEAAIGAAPGWRTLLYKPHGGVTPAHNYLVADSDYVEVLTEIDIQSPIPDEVKRRREGRGFLFLGCRFHDQMLRTYARQIMKRSAGPHWAVLPAEPMTRNERNFLEQQGISPIEVPLEEIGRAIAA